MSFRDLPKLLDHTCPCTLLLFIAYAIVRTEPSATSAKPEKKKKVAVENLAPPHTCNSSKPLKERRDPSFPYMHSACNLT